MQPQPHPAAGTRALHLALGTGQTAAGPDWHHTTRPADNASADLRLDTVFVSLLKAYRPSGGLAQGDELATRLHIDGGGGYARLARWIVGRQVFSFAWHEQFWLPLFQFNPGDLTLHSGLRPVLAELGAVMDGWALAHWFVQPNDALQGQTPVLMWSSDWPEVFQAARQQRFVTKG